MTTIGHTISEIYWRNKLHRHGNSSAHQAAESVLNHPKQRSLETSILRANRKCDTTTANLFRTAYYLAKNDRPYTDQPGLCELQKLNGADVGVTLHSRASAIEIINTIAHEMKQRLCHSIIEHNLKIGIMLDEFTSISNKSTLIVYVRCVFPETDNAIAFPLDLIELSDLGASCITEETLKSLHEHGFDSDYLSKNFVGVGSDGASTVVGKQSGVLTRLKELYPQLILWHCMSHRVELAVADSTKVMNAVNHMMSFMDKLYSLYSQSPTAQRGLETCAAQLDLQLKKIGRVLGTRWAASSFRSVQAV
jgi:hypothetical protein